MQVIAHTASAALAPPPSAQIIPKAPEEPATLRQDDALGIIQPRRFEPPTKADAQSVVQAQIKEDVAEKPAIPDDSAKIEFEQRKEADARTKSIMGLLPASPSQMTKLMSALAAATSAEAIADIKLEA